MKQTNEASPTSDQDRIRFHCPRCNKALSVLKAHAGEQGRCPGCNAVIHIPRIDVSPDESTRQPPEEHARPILRDSTTTIPISLGDVGPLVKQLIAAQKQKSPGSDTGKAIDQVIAGLSVSCPLCGKLSENAVAMLCMAGADFLNNAIFGGPNTAALAQARCPSCGGDLANVTLDRTEITAIPSLARVVSEDTGATDGATLCYFCQKNVGEYDCKYQVQQFKIFISRCKACKEAHGHCARVGYQWMGYGILIVGILAGIITGIVFASSLTPGPRWLVQTHFGLFWSGVVMGLIGGGWIGGLGGLLIGTRIANGGLIGIKPLSTHWEHPLVKGKRARLEEYVERELTKG